MSYTNGAPLGSIEDRTRRLQLLGVAPEVIAPLLDYIDALNAAQLKLADQYAHLLVDGWTEDPVVREEARTGPARVLAEYFDIDPAATSAGKYLQVVNMAPRHRDGVTAPSSVHSVVIKATGEVCKSGGWRKGPAKSTSKARKGQPLVAYVLTDPDSYAAMVGRLDTYGSYLYSR